MKIVPHFLLGLLASLSSAVCALPVEPIAIYPTKFFIALEGGYSHSKTDGVQLNVINLFDVENFLSVTSNSENSRFGARIALGAVKQLCELWGLSAEMGWGYYGRTRFPLSSSGFLTEFLDFNAIHVKSSLNGFDLLAGIVFTQTCYELYFKAGALIQNAHTEFNVDRTQFFAPVQAGLLGNVNIKANHTEALPEIKLGGAYYFYDNWAITASWTHVFGTRTKMPINIDPSSTELIIPINTRNTTLDIAMLGLQYRFC